MIGMTLSDRAAVSADGIFNKTCRLRRQLAQAEGRPFIPNTAARARLHRAFAGVAADDRPGLITRVFGPQ